MFSHNCCVDQLNLQWSVLIFLFLFLFVVIFSLVHVFRFVSELSGVVSSLFPEAYHAVIFAILVLWKYRHP
ncbi:hypothetical protein CRM84_11180 [Escherichia coli]|nr:hypothetical protein CRM84_11180 [Escherichia coli]